MCLTDENYRARNCPDPPTKTYLLSEVNKLLHEQGGTLGDTSDHIPDQGWMLQCLSTLDPDHPIFDQAYVAPPVRKKQAQTDKQITGHEDFFAGLPPLTYK